MIVCSQTTSQGDSLCFSKEEAKLIMQDLKRVNLLDSIIINQELQIINFKSVLRNNKEQILLFTNRNTKISKELDKTYLKLKLSKKLTFFGVPIAFGGGILTAILLSK